MLKDYYKILNILPQATQKEVETAYKAMAKKWHPDKNIGQDTTNQMQLLSESYSVLKNSEKRKAYNVEYYRYHLSKINFQSKDGATPRIVCCYYCGKNIANERFTFSETLYKETSRSYFPQRKVWFKSATLKIPRCEECFKTHHSNASIFVLLPLVSFAIIGLILGLTIWSMWFLCLVGGCIIGGIIGGILSYIDSSIIAKEAGIKKETDIYDFEPFSELQRDGWTTSKPTA